MKFGKVDNPESVDFTLPPDHPDTKDILSKGKKPLTVYVGCAKWNKQDLKGFYPRGTKDELGYYSSQFNSIELNATFYRFFPPQQFEKWRDKVPDNFRFFTKVTQDISHWKRLNETERLVDEYIYATNHLNEKLGVPFLQMHNNFAPKDFERVQKFMEHWPKDFPLAVEFRHTDWYNDASVANELYALLEQTNKQNIIVDTAGRRDLLHMRLTTPNAFVRYVGANHQSDYARLDDWVERIKTWADQGLEQLGFFVHQNLEKESPLLSAYFIRQLNKAMSLELKVSATLNDGELPF